MPREPQSEMLENIRQALGGSSAQKSSYHENKEVNTTLPAEAPKETLIHTFETELRLVGGIPHRVANPIQLDDVLKTILGTEKAINAVLSANPILTKAYIINTLMELCRHVTTWEKEAGDHPPEDHSRACFEAQVGFSGVDFVLAETGTLVVSSRTEGSQLTSLAPPIHVAFYRPSQVVAELEQVLDGLAGRKSGPDDRIKGHSVVFITGPSRTGDIELTLTLGVHGPQQVHAVLIEDTLDPSPQPTSPEETS